MKLKRLVIILSLAIVAYTVVCIAITDRGQHLPQFYYSLDKSKSWSDLASGFDPRMSDREYDAIRSQYFYDVIAPKLSDKSEELGSYEYFMRRTDRQWQWNRRLFHGGPPTIVLPASLVPAGYLVVVLVVWTWRKMIRPLGSIARDEGVAGVAQVILHGRKSRPSDEDR